MIMNNDNLCYPLCCYYATSRSLSSINVYFMKKFGFFVTSDNFTLPGGNSIFSNDTNSVRESLNYI